MFDIYTDIAAYMTWIGTTIKKMGGMLACDLAIEETNPEGHYFLAYNLGYQESISVHPTRRQIFAGKPYSIFPNI